MPLTKDGKKTLESMIAQYGKGKGRSVFYASINAKKPGSENWEAKKRSHSMAQAVGRRRRRGT